MLNTNAVYKECICRGLPSIWIITNSGLNYVVKLGHNLLWFQQMAYLCRHILHISHCIRLFLFWFICLFMTIFMVWLTPYVFRLDLNLCSLRGDKPIWLHFSLSSCFFIPNMCSWMLIQVWMLTQMLTYMLLQIKCQFKQPFSDSSITYYIVVLLPSWHSSIFSSIHLSLGKL